MVPVIYAPEAERDLDGITASALVFFNLTFFPMRNLGLNGMMRRIADPTLYDHRRSQQPINIFVSLCAFGLGKIPRVQDSRRLVKRARIEF